MPHPPWLDDLADTFATVDLEHDGGGAPEVTTAALEAAWAFLTTLTTDTPRPQVVPRNAGGVQLEWHAGRGGVGVDLELAFAADGRLSGLCWDASGDRAPAWARGVVARALHRVR